MLASVCVGRSGRSVRVVGLSVVVAVSWGRVVPSRVGCSVGRGGVGLGGSRGVGRRRRSGVGPGSLRRVGCRAPLAFSFLCAHLASPRHRAPTALHAPRPESLTLENQKPRETENKTRLCARRSGDSIRPPAPAREEAAIRCRPPHLREKKRRFEPARPHPLIIRPRPGPPRASATACEKANEHAVSPKPRPL